MTYKVTWREQDSSGWFVQRRKLVASDEIRDVIDALFERGIYEHCVKRVNG